MKSLKEQIAELMAAGYKALTAQAKVAHDAVLLAMHRSGFKLKSAIKGGVVMSMGFALREDYPLDENC